MEKFEVGRKMLAVHGEDGNWDCDEYMHGLYNGMEMMLSMIEDREAEFREAPNRFRKYNDEHIAMMAQGL